jgi:hypothetical protein
LEIADLAEVVVDLSGVRLLVVQIPDGGRQIHGRKLALERSAFGLVIKVVAFADLRAAFGVQVIGRDNVVLREQDGGFGSHGILPFRWDCQDMLGSSYSGASPASIEVTHRVDKRLKNGKVDRRLNVIFEGKEVSCPFQE